jgi:membrane protease YdiL (CAAX protease family)
MMDAFLDLSKRGKNDWWRFLLAVLLIFFLWQVVGAIPTVFLIILVNLDNNPATAVTSQGVVGLDPLLSFTALMLASVCFMVGIYLAIRFIHKRSLLTLVTPAPSFDWLRFAQGFSVWFILSGFLALAEALLHPGRYLLTLDWKQYIPLVFLALIFVPIQTSAEELFFRGYFLQGVGLRLRNIWILSILSGLVFGLPHLLNPEARINYWLFGLYYFFIGAVLAFVALRDGRLELALGLHAANNLFSALFANYSGSVLPTPAMFTVTTLDANYSVPSAVLGLIVFVLIFKNSLDNRVDRDSSGL